MPSSRRPSGGFSWAVVGRCYVASVLAALAGVPLWSVVAVSELNFCNIAGFGCLGWLLIGLGIAMALAFAGGRLLGPYLRLRLGTLLVCIVGLLALAAFGSRYAYDIPLVALLVLWPVLGALVEAYGGRAFWLVVPVTGAVGLATVWHFEQPGLTTRLAQLGGEHVAVYGPTDDAAWEFGLVTEDLTGDGITYRATVDDGPDARTRIEVRLRPSPGGDGRSVTDCAEGSRCLAHSDTEIGLRLPDGGWDTTRQDTVLRAMTPRGSYWLATRQLPLHRTVYDLTH